MVRDICLTCISWTLKEIKSAMTHIAEMQYMIKTAGYSLLEHKKNLDILEELHIQPILEFIKD